MQDVRQGVAQYFLLGVIQVYIIRLLVPYIFFFFWRELSADIDFSFLFSCACFSGVFSSAGDKHLYHQRIHFLQTIESTLCFRSF